jgi:glycine/D-amino acid oxidase-like deaminating enzyme
VGEVGRVLSTGYVNGELSHWLRAAGRTGPTRPPLPGAGQADVVVVGAGLTGLWAAYALRRSAPQRSVTLLEAEHVGFGASGRNGGWLSHLVPGNRARYAAGPGGTGGAVRLQAAMVAGIDEVLATCTREGIDADQHRGGNLVVATTPAGLHRLREVCAADLRYGLGAEQSELLDARRTRERVDVQGAVGGLLHPMVARVDPAKLVIGLAAAVERLGGVIHEQTRVQAVAPGRVLTSRGELVAGSVLVCTEGYGAPMLGRRSIIPVNSSMIATEPLAGSDWQRIGWTGRECLSDAAHTFVYAQRTADDRIAIGGRGRPYRFGSGIAVRGETHPRTVAELLGRLRTFFPGVSFEVAHAWSGVLGVTRDWCATVRYDPGRGIGLAAGYAGHGVTAAHVAGRTLADLVLGRESELVDLPWVDHRSPRWEPEPVRWVGVHGMYRLFRLADRWEERRGAQRTSLLARVGGRLAGLEE